MMNKLYQAAIAAEQAAQEAKAAEQAQARKEHQGACQLIESRLMRRITKFGDLLGVLPIETANVGYSIYPNEPSCQLWFDLDDGDVLTIDLATTGSGLDFGLQDQNAELVWGFYGVPESPASYQEFLVSLGTALKERKRRTGPLSHSRPSSSPEAF